jgi:tetratricopeptide (TPR) repeat protein
VNHSPKGKFMSEITEIQKITNNKTKFFTQNKIKISALVVAIFIIIMAFAFYEDPNSYKGMLKRAEDYLKEGKAASALEIYSKIVRINPNNYALHVKLAEIYILVDEKDMAKVEYLRAIMLKQKGKFQAHFGLIDIYEKENRFDLAQGFLEEIKDIQNYQVQNKSGKLYSEWALYKINTDKMEALRKFKKAYEFYKPVNYPEAQKTLKIIKQLYLDISDDLKKSGKIKQAEEILELGIKYNDNALIHYKLAQLNDTYLSIDKALEEYAKAFEMDKKVGSLNSYIELLLKKANILAQQGDVVGSQLYYTKAKRLDQNLNLPLNPDARVIFNETSTSLNEDLENDILIPEISFRLTNLRKDPIKDLTAKVVFMNHDKNLSEKTITIADKENPLKGTSETSEITVSSSAPIHHVFDTHNIVVQIYLSGENSSSWKLFRNIKIERERKPVSITR